MQEKIHFPNSKGNKLCGILSNPSSSKTVPIIILCHGFTTSKDNNTNKTLELNLNKENIATFRFDFFGHGESEGDFANITISEGVDDILNAIKYLKHRGFSKIGLVGSSYGGMTGLVAASKTADLFVLVLKSPVSEYYEVEENRRTKQELAEWKTKGFVIHVTSKGEQKKLNYSYFEDFKNHNGYASAKKIQIPTLIVHGDKDSAVPVEQSIKTSKIIKNCKLEIIKGADHWYANPGEFEKMIDFISKFIIEHCK